ncbi:MAG: dockerin type I repeat-containing protein [Phycisphaerales bacterium]
MDSSRQHLFASILFAACSGAAHGGFFDFTSNPTGNSADMAAWAASIGPYTIDSSVDFESHPDGDLVADYYPGVTLSGTNVIVAHGAGSRSGAATRPLSEGEGPLGAFQGYVVNTATAEGWSLTVTFDAPVVAAGFMTADLFNAFGDNSLMIESFDGDDASGAFLGVAWSSALNFELNNRYFMGLGDPLGRIKSIRISTAAVLYGDTQYVDGVSYAVATAPPCPADLTGDGVVNGADLGIVLGSWGAGGAADLDGDGTVNATDLAIVLGAWGACP